MVGGVGVFGMGKKEGGRLIRPVIHTLHTTITHIHTKTHTQTHIIYITPPTHLPRLRPHEEPDAALDGGRERVDVPVLRRRRRLLAPLLLVGVAGGGGGGRGADGVPGPVFCFGGGWCGNYVHVCMYIHGYVHVYFYAHQAS